MAQRLAAAALAAALPLLASAYSWSFGSQPPQCGNATINVSGGSPPYWVLVIPYGISPLPNNTEARKIQNEGPFASASISFKLNYPANSQFVAVVSDSTGFASGGTSAGVLVAGSSDSSCFDASQNVQPLFTYSINPQGVIAQCVPTRISWFPSANISGTPTFQGVIPGGDSFQIPESNLTQVPEQGTGFSWTPPLRGGTTLLLVAGDDRGNGTGGSSSYTVNPGLSNDNSCLQSDSPSSTPGSPAGGSYATSTSGAGTGGSGGGSSGGGGNSTGGGGGGSSDNSHSTNVGAIVGGTVGGVVALIALALVALFFIRRRRLHEKQKVRPDLLQGDDGEEGGATRTNELPQYYQPEPYLMADSTVDRSSLGGLTSDGRRPSTSMLTDTDGRPLSMLLSDGHGSEGRSTTPDPSTSVSTGTRKTPMRQMRPVNIIQHADAGPSAPHEEADQEPETVELPPAYTNIRK